MIVVKTNPAGQQQWNGPLTGQGGSGTFVLAHLSDPHLSSLNGVHLGDLLNKRLFGYLSWQRRRRHLHQPHILEALVHDLGTMAPDHIAVTGDLTQVGLPDEFRQAADWLRKLGTPDRVTVIPGNHDNYVAAPWQDTFQAWAPYLAGDDGVATDLYPSLRIRGPLALISLSSGRPSAPLLAVGSLGQRQLTLLEELLQQTRRRGLLRVVLLHHPPVPGSTAWRKRLTDARQFAEVIARQGAALILHGHAHYCMMRELAAGVQSVPVIGVSSASASDTKPQRAARYHLYHFERADDGWRTQLFARTYSADLQRFVAAQQQELQLPDVLAAEPYFALCGLR